MYSESQDFVIHNTKSGKSLLSMNSPSISKTHELSEIKNKQKWDNLVTSQFLPETHVFQATHTLPSNSSVENIRPSTVSETRPVFKLHFHDYFRHSSLIHPQCQDIHFCITINLFLHKMKESPRHKDRSLFKY